MKKIILTSVGCFCFLFPSFAQFRYGVKGGFNFANVKHIGSTDNKMRLGFNTGFFMQIGIVKQFMIQPEILYSVKGYSFPATVYNSNGTLRLNYLAIPVLARFSRAAGFALLFGPEFGLLLNANSEFDGKDHDVSRNFRKLDIGVGECRLAVMLSSAAIFIFGYLFLFSLFFYSVYMQTDKIVKRIHCG